MSVDIRIFNVEILNEEKVKWLASLKRGLKLNFHMNILLKKSVKSITI